LAGADGKLTHGFEILAVKIGRGAQHRPVRAGDRVDGAVIVSRNPRDDRAIAKTKHKFRAKLHLAGTSKYDAYQVGRAIRGGHEVDDRGAAGFGLEFGLEDERIGKVATSDIW